MTLKFSWILQNKRRVFKICPTGIHETQIWIPLSLRPAGFELQATLRHRLNQNDPEHYTVKGNICELPVLPKNQNLNRIRSNVNHFRVTCLLNYVLWVTQNEFEQYKVICSSHAFYLSTHRVTNLILCRCTISFIRVTAKLHVVTRVSSLKMTLPWTLQGLKYPLYVLLVLHSHKIVSVLLSG